MNEIVYEKASGCIYIRKQYNGIHFYSPLCTKKFLLDTYTIGKEGFSDCFIKDSGANLTIDWFTKSEAFETHMLPMGVTITDKGIENIHILMKNNHGKR